MILRGAWPTLQLEQVVEFGEHQQKRQLLVGTAQHTISRALRGLPLNNIRGTEDRAVDLPRAREVDDQTPGTFLQLFQQLVAARRNAVRESSPSSSGAPRPSRPDAWTLSPAPPQSAPVVHRPGGYATRCHRANCGPSTALSKRGEASHPLACRSGTFARSFARACLDPIPRGRVAYLRERSHRHTPRWSSAASPRCPGVHPRSHVKDEHPYRRAGQDREGYWADWARQLEWFRPWDKVLEWRPPHARGSWRHAHASVNCLDRHVRDGRADKIALIWEGSPSAGGRSSPTGAPRTREPVRECPQEYGRQAGDRVAIYMGMVPEVAVAMLACARIGAPHTVVFGGFSAESLRDRNQRLPGKGPRLRRTAAIVAAAWCHSGQRRRRPPGHAQHPQRGGVEAYGPGVSLRAGRDHWWHDLNGEAAPKCEPGTWTPRIR